MTPPAPDPRVSVALLKLAEAEDNLRRIGEARTAEKVRAIADEIHAAVRSEHRWKRLIDFVSEDS
jgi:bifunctional pyridoxal-dependent enzyme with beta-cystathionase and maltose regulon repressor activities